MTGPGTAALRSLATAAVAAGAAAAARRLIEAGPARRAPARWLRTNHRGESVTLAEGPAWVAGALAGIAASPLPGRVRGALATAAAGAGGFGLLDDLGERGHAKGLRGHLGALRHGRVTTGAAKIAGIGATGLLSALLVSGARPDRAGTPAGRVADVLVDGALIASAANVVNLLDLRPGRAAKAYLVHAPALLGRAGPGYAAGLGATAALLPGDLGERSMMGDCGANAAGALLGAVTAASAPRAVRVVALAGAVALTLASERVSFSAVIERTAWLRRLDGWGRRP